MENSFQVSNKSVMMAPNKLNNDVHWSYCFNTNQTGVDWTEKNAISLWKLLRQDKCKKSYHLDNDAFHLLINWRKYLG